MSPRAVTLTTTITAAGDVSDFDATTTANMRAALAQQLGVPVDSIVLTVAAASVVISFTVSTGDAAQATALQQTMQSTLSTPAAATNFFASAGANVTITSAPNITVATATGPVPLFPSMPPPQLPPPTAPPPPPVGGVSGSGVPALDATGGSAQTAEGGGSSVTGELFLAVVAVLAFIILALLLVICVLVKRMQAKAVEKEKDIYDISVGLPSFQNQDRNVNTERENLSASNSFDLPKMGRIAIKKSPSGGASADRGE